MHIHLSGLLTLPHPLNVFIKKIKIKKEHTQTEDSPFEDQVIKTITNHHEHLYLQTNEREKERGQQTTKIINKIESLRN